MASFLGDLVRGVSQASNQFPEAMRNRLLMQRDQAKTDEANRVRQRQELFQSTQFESDLLGDKADAVQDDMDALNDQMNAAYKAGVDVPPDAYERLEQLREQRTGFEKQRTDLATRFLGNYPVRQHVGTPIDPDKPDPDAVVMVEDPDTGEVLQETQYRPEKLGQIIVAKQKEEGREKLFKGALNSVKSIGYSQSPGAALALFAQLLPNATEDELARVSKAIIAPDDNWTPDRITAFVDHVQNSSNGEALLKYLPDHVREQVLFQVIEGGGKIGGKLTAGQIEDLSGVLLAVSLLGDLSLSVEKNRDIMGVYEEIEMGIQQSPLIRWSTETIFPAAGKELVRKERLKAEIDHVRQRVGKALEGGVLRKEDEIKYRVILATLGNDPDVALYKMSNMIIGLKRQYRLAKELMEQYGGAGDYKMDEAYKTILPVDPQKATLPELLWWAEQGWDDVYTEALIDSRFPEKKE